MLVFALVTEQLTITAPHEAQPHLNQANGPAAQIVCFPASVMRALPNNAYRDVAMAVAFQPPIHCTQSENVPGVAFRLID